MRGTRVLIAHNLCTCITINPDIPIPHPFDPSMPTTDPTWMLPLISNACSTLLFAASPRYRGFRVRSAGGQPVREGSTQTGPRQHLLWFPLFQVRTMCTRSGLFAGIVMHHIESCTAAA